MSCTTSISGAPTPVSSDSRPTVSVDALRSCSFCKKVKVPTLSKFKLCSDCREKFRNVQQKRRDIRKVLGTTNRERLCNSSNVESIGQTSTNNPVETICTEYQTSSDLFAALKLLNVSTSPLSNRIGQFIQFHGSYTIVTASDINNLQRVWLLAFELRSKAWLPFQFQPPLSLIGDEDTQTLCFACTCTETPTNLAPTSIVPYGKASATSHYNSFIREVCRGVITLKSIVDKTHPLGIPGQHIVVRVEHPLSKYHSHGHPHMSKTRL
ncbi:hypothetical protein BYT27DRAFT_7336484 [Phlegmacium glaucopus]|nr:hypothetical protein BYT27DRAFT_7336484 [Phlegmacium glaucopus]